MSTPHNHQELGEPLRNKKKRGAVFIVILVTIVVHVLALGGLAAIKIIEVLQPVREFEAPPIVERTPPPPPPPPPPPTTKRTQRSLPRPQPLAAQNPQNMSVPAISIQDSDLSIGGGRGFGGGLGELGGGAMDSIRLTSFGFDRALEGTLEGSLYDLKRDRNGKPISGDITSRYIDSIRNLRVEGLSRKFFKVETNLYLSYLIMPREPAENGPRSFGVEKTVKANYIAVHYIGSYKPAKTGRFRLIGAGDNVLMVKINGKMVLDGSVGMWDKQSNWRRPKADREPEHYFDSSGNGKIPAVAGNWFKLQSGVDTEVEILIGETSGGVSGAYLLIEEEGQPDLEIFSTRPLSDQDKKHLRSVHPDAAQFIK